MKQLFGDVPASTSQSLCEGAEFSLDGSTRAHRAFVASAKVPYMPLKVVRKPVGCVAKGILVFLGDERDEIH